MHDIVSASRQQLKSTAKLKQKKYRLLYNLGFGEGFRLFKSAVQRAPDIIESLIISPDCQQDHMQQIIRLSEKHAISVYTTDSKSMKSISDEQTPSGILFTFKAESFKSDNIDNIKSDTCLYLENISDPGNLGSILRTTAWFGCLDIMLGPQCVDILNPKVIRSSAGGIFHCNIYQNIDLKRVSAFSKKMNFSIISTVVKDGTSLYRWKKSAKNLIFLGSEAHGLSMEAQNMADIRLTIPGSDKIESLNISVSAGVLLSHVTKIQN